MKKYQIGFIVVLILGIILFEVIKPDLEQEAISVVEKMIEGYNEKDLDLLKETLTEELYSEIENIENRDDTYNAVEIIRLDISELNTLDAKVDYDIIVSEPNWRDDTITGTFHLIRINNKWVIAQID